MCLWFYIPLPGRSWHLWHGMMLKLLLTSRISYLLGSMYHFTEVAELLKEAFFTYTCSIVYSCISFFLLISYTEIHQWISLQKYRKWKFLTDGCHASAVHSFKHQQKKCGSGPWRVSQSAIQAPSSKRIAQGVCREVKIQFSTIL